MTEHKSDRVNELYKGELFDKKNQEVCRQRINWICSQAEGERVLDYGCSQGIASIILGREGFRVTGIDIDSTVIDYALSELEQETDYVKQCVDFQLVSAGHLDFDDDTFDSVLFGEVIEHLARPEVTLRELRRVLKPGGRVIITTPFGVLPHPDHMHTYYLSNFVETISQFFALKDVHVLDKYICCLALVAGAEATMPETSDPAQLLKHSEAAFERAEWAYIDWRQKLRVQYHLQAKEVEKLQVTVNQLNLQFEDLIKEHKAGIERLKAEHARQIEQLEGRYRKQTQLEIQQLRKTKSKYQSSERLAEQLRGRLSRQKDQLEYFRTELDLRGQEVRYRLGDALVRSCYHPAELFCLPGRTFKLFLEGLRRRSERQKSAQSEMVLLSADSATMDAKSAAEIASGGGGGQAEVVVGRGVPGSAKESRPEISFTPAARPNMAPRLSLKAGVIMDEFTIECFRDECELITFTPHNWKEVLSAQRPEFLFVESTWKGNDGAWRYKVNRPEYKADDPLPQLVNWCRSQNIPTVFWNKEDPPNFDRFIAAAELFAYIFTTDADCIPRYRARVKHDRVWALPFAAQPSIHNPINSKRKRLGNLCFAGTYHREKYPQRQHDLELLLGPAKTRGLTIFDRQHGYGQEQRYSFPPEYHEFVRGGLPYMEMVQAYKAYEAFLNINSVRESPTMFSRRVLELLACGTPVISTPAAGMERLLGSDVVAIVDSEEQAARWMDRLLRDAEFRDRMVVKGQRRIFLEHTYEHRLRTVIETLGLACPPPRRRVSVVTVTNRPGFLDRVIENYQRQAYADKELIVVLNSDSFSVSEAEEKLAAVPDARVYSRPEAQTLGQCLNFAIDQSQADYFAKFDDDDFYGEHYLTDQINAFLYSGTEIVGKRAYFAYLEGQRCLALRFPDREHRHVKFVSGATLIVRRDLFEEQRFPENVQRGVDTQFQQACLDRGLGIYATDRYNFVANRLKSTDGHTWQISDEEFLDKCRIVAYLDNYRAQVSV